MKAIKLNLIVLVLLSTLTQIAKAQVTQQWVRNYGGTSNDVPYKVKI